MAKRTSGIGSGGGGGILGSGIFGFFGTTIQCDSKDESMYCNIMKLFNLLIVFFVIAYILYILYNIFIAPSMTKRR
jgi:hypothetical protein